MEQGGGNIKLCSALLQQEENLLEAVKDLIFACTFHPMWPTLIFLHKIYKLRFVVAVWQHGKQFRSYKTGVQITASCVVP